MPALHHQKVRPAGMATPVLPSQALLHISPPDIFLPSCFQLNPRSSVALSELPVVGIEKLKIVSSSHLERRELFLTP